ncbi:MAG TPA: ferrous iron transporter B [Firmicutes bacterium]|jgi:ferrous iron transport protein B|nr:ferrous iron transporter B [Bacillota bacterium]
MTEVRTIAVVGNPNCGKTTLFNGLTGSNQRVGNWPGVTVEKKEGVLQIEGQKISLVDLPGIYSLTAQSEDERVARDYILSGEPGLVINILDATNLERNLYLTTQLMEMGVPVLLVVNMMDLAAGKGITIDLPQLAKGLGCPAVGISATHKKELHNVKDAIAKAWRQQAVSDKLTEYPAEIEAVIAAWSPQLKEAKGILAVNPRWAALKLLEQDSWVTDKVTGAGILKKTQIKDELDRLEIKLKDTPDIIMAESRYRLIHNLTGNGVHRGAARESMSDRIDKIVMHRLLGIPIFLVALYLMFWVTMNFGGSFIDFFDILFGTIFVDGFGVLLSMIHTPQWLITILAGGIGAGVQTLSTFIPVIFMMFLMLSILEDSGYMARAAFVMDRFLRWIGLPGKAFVPMLVGLGCNVPAIMSTRTLENKRDRYLTVFMIPFMSCGARLPVYALFGAAFFGAGASNMVFSLYLIGILFAILTGLLLKNTLFKGERSNFVMELPPYHAPHFKNVMEYTWSRLKVFMFRTKVIIVIVTVLAFLNSFGINGTFGNEDSPNSVLAQIGKTITPVFEPMGVERENWPATVGLFTGIFAKEAVVGTLNSLYSQIDSATSQKEGGAAEEDKGFDLWGGVKDAFASIPEALSGVWESLRDPLGLGVISDDKKEVAEEVGADQRVYSVMQHYFTKGPLQAYAYLLFILLYMPCVVALGAAVREIGKGYGWLSMAYLTVLAWVSATLFYQITLGHQLIWVIIPLALLALTAITFWWLGKRNLQTLDVTERRNLGA